MFACDCKRKDLTSVWPRDDGCRSHRKIADQETAEYERVAEEEYPHHGLSPGNTSKSLLIGRPVFYEPFQAVRARPGNFAHIDNPQNSAIAA